MTIDELYRFVQLIANKEQRGFIKPSEFNLLAQQAQLDLIHDRVARYKTEAESNRQQSPALIQNHSVLDDIRTVIRRAQLKYTNPNPDTTNNIVNGVFEYPKYGFGGKNGKLEIFEYLHYLRLYQAKQGGNVKSDLVPEDVPPGFIEVDGGQSSDGDIELLTHDQLAKRLKSQICTINENNMVAVMLNDGFEIYTYDDTGDDGITELKEETTTNVDSLSGSTSTSTSSQRIFLVYVGKPLAPKWGYTMVNDQYVYNASSANTQQLTLPTKTHREIAQRMLSYIGISLRDQEPMAYAEAKVKDQTIQRR